MKDNLYVLESMMEMQYCALFRADEMSIKDWHVFMGHPSISTMKHMKLITFSESGEHIEEIKNCEVCIRAKQTRNPFPQLEHITSNLFELVDADAGVLMVGSA